MFTHKSRGIEIMPAVFETGSIVNKMIVSVQSGQSGPLTGWPPERRPKKTMLIRLPPSHVGACGTGAETSAVGIAATGVPCAFSTGVPKTLLSTLQLAGGMPSNVVNCQHVTKSLVKIYKPTAKASAAIQNTIWRTEGRPIFENLKFLKKSANRFIINST